MEENTEFSMFEDRAYANPSLSRDEQLQFIDTLRDTQTANTQQINADTYALGSQLPSNLGGLSGAENTFIARYQTPQTNQAVANLRLAAQQSALNTALSNLQNAYKKRYNDAVLNYQKRAATPTTTNNPDTPNPTLPVNTNSGSGEGVRTNEEVEAARKLFSSGSFQQTQNTLQKIINDLKSGDASKSQSVPFYVPNTQYTPNGPWAPGSESVMTGIIYRDNTGAVTGASYNGKEYGAEEALELLQGLAKQNKIYNTAGTRFRPTDFALDFNLMDTGSLLLNNSARR